MKGGNMFFADIKKLFRTEKHPLMCPQQEKTTAFIYTISYSVNA